METLYTYIPWPTRPNDERARKRFRILVAEFERLLEHEELAPSAGKRRLRVLDLMAASGIAGAALASALAMNGYIVELVVVNVRVSEALHLSQWIAMGRAEAVIGEFAAADALRSPTRNEL